MLLLEDPALFRFGAFRPSVRDDSEEAEKPLKDCFLLTRGLIVVSGVLDSM